LTEAGCASSLNPPGSENRVGSIGVRMPWQPMRAVMLDAEGRYIRDSEPDETGTIVVTGPNLFKGYLNEIHNKGLPCSEVSGRSLPMQQPVLQLVQPSRHSR